MQHYRHGKSFNSTFFPPVTVADYADADPAVVKSGRMKKAVTNAVEKEGEFTSCFFLNVIIITFLFFFVFSLSY